MFCMQAAVGLSKSLGVSMVALTDSESDGGDDDEDDLDL